MEENYKELEFNFVNESGEIVFDLYDAVWMVAFFDCFGCGRVLRFQKEYQPVPLHYETLLKKCKTVTCPKCGAQHRHGELEGEDFVFSIVSPVFNDPNQLDLFTSLVT
jgi:hypothetical protein